jgi:hypothetical protein
MLGDVVEPEESARPAAASVKHPSDLKFNAGVEVVTMVGGARTGM